MGAPMHHNSDAGSAKILILVLLAVLAYVIVITYRDAAPKVRAMGEATNACVARGEQYFRDIGSWPRLSSGEDAKLEVWRRCRNIPTAF